MFCRGSPRLTGFLVTVCVAITCLFCVQATLIALDRIEHALEIDHDPSPLAGAVQHCTDVPNACEASGGADHPISHAHLGDAATTVLPGTAPSLAAADFNAAPASLAGNRTGTGLTHRAPDRPPKDSTENVA